jgi:ABC-type antimicrobial peptide transport system permease subunit
MIVGEGLVLVGMGIAIGAPAAYGTARLAASLLYNIAPSDAGSLGGAAATMLAVGVVACAIPALRIARITPAEALRLD